MAPPKISRHIFGALYGNLKTFPVDDRGADFVIFLLGDPHLFKRRMRSQDGATNPGRVFSLGRSDDVDFHGGRSQCRDLLVHSLGEARQQGRSAGKNKVGVENFTDVDVALPNAVVRIQVNAEAVAT